jgi:PAS domain S-box-containing protein
MQGDGKAHFPNASEDYVISGGGQVWMNSAVHLAETVMEGWFIPWTSLLYISSACENLTGYSPLSFKSHPRLLFDLIYGEDRDFFIRYLKSTLLLGGVRNVNVRFRHSSGTWRWGNVIISKRDHPQNEGATYHFQVRDITSAYGEELTSPLVPFRFYDLLNIQEALIAVSLPDTTLTYVNDAYARFHGVAPARLIGARWIDFVPETERTKNLELLQSFGPAKTRDVIENYAVDREGNFKWHSWIVKAHFDSRGRIIEFSTTGHDITALKLLNERLSISEERYRAVVGNMGEMIIRHDIESTILFVNESFASFIGTSVGDITGQKWFHLVDPEMAAGIKLKMSELTQDHPTDRIEMAHTRFDGVERWITWISTGIFNDSGELTELQVVGRDTTERKDYERQLQKAQEDLLEAQRRLEQENLYLREKVSISRTLDGIVAGSESMHEVFEKAGQVANTDAPVLLMGETGTGKELIAQAIHNDSKRKRKTMVTVNCAALPVSLIENELFGREKGAYTGALARQPGRFELAHQSTIFLDEIGELPVEIQVKLLRVLQFGEYQMLGSPETKKVDVRIIAATNKNLAEAVTNGSFRSDLFYRLNVFPITLPPLRQRKVDIPSLVFHFIDEIGNQIGKRIEKVSTDSMNRLLRYDWPGNVRELRNIIEYNMILAKGPVLELRLHEDAVSAEKTNTLNEQTKVMIERVLQQTGWKIRGKDGAAERLGMKESTLRFKMKKLGISRPNG